MSGSARAPDDWPFATSNALRIVGGEGASLFADDGRRILDAAGGAIVSNVGHGRRQVMEAMTNGAATASYVVPIWRTPERESLVRRLRERWLCRAIYISCSSVRVAARKASKLRSRSRFSTSPLAAKINAQRYCLVTFRITGRLLQWPDCRDTTPESGDWKDSCRNSRMCQRLRPLRCSTWSASRRCRVVLSADDARYYRSGRSRHGCRARLS